MKKLIWVICLVLLWCISSAITFGSQAYIADAFSGYLARYDLVTQESSLVGSFGTVTNISGLAYNPVQQIMYGISPVTCSLYSIDLTTGYATRIGAFGTSITMHGLAYDITTDTLYATAASQIEQYLYRINMSTGKATYIATTGTQISGLAVDPQTGILYGSPASQSPYASHGLYSIDKITGAVTRIGTQTLSYNGLAFDAATGLLLGVRNINDSLYFINKDHGQSTLYANIGTLCANPLGLEIIIPEPATAMLMLLGAAWMTAKRRR